MPELRFVVKRDGVFKAYSGVWDTAEGAWYDGPGHDDAIYAAGVPMWDEPLRTAEVAAELNGHDCTQDCYERKG